MGMRQSSAHKTSKPGQKVCGRLFFWRPFVKVSKGNYKDLLGWVVSIWVYGVSF